MLFVIDTARFSIIRVRFLVLYIACMMSDENVVLVLLTLPLPLNFSAMKLFRASAANRSTVKSEKSTEGLRIEDDGLK